MSTSEQPAPKDAIRDLASLVETDEERQERLKQPVGAADVAIIKQTCPDIPDTFIFSLMFGGR